MIFAYNSIFWCVPSSFLDRFSKFKTLNRSELPRGWPRSRQNCPRVYFYKVIQRRVKKLYVLRAVFDKIVFLRKGGYFFMEMKNSWSKKFIIWVKLGHGIGSRKKFFQSYIIPGGYQGLGLLLIKNCSYKYYITSCLKWTTFVYIFK